MLRATAATASGAFCVVLTGLGLQVRAGEDPVLGRGEPVARPPRPIVVRRLVVRRVVEAAVTPTAAPPAAGTAPPAAGAAAPAPPPPAAATPAPAVTRAS